MSSAYKLPTYPHEQHESYREDDEKQCERHRTHINQQEDSVAGCSDTLLRMRHR